MLCYTSRDSESWYHFQRACLHVLVCQCQHIKKWFRRHVLWLRVFRFVCSAELAKSRHHDIALQPL